MMPWCLAAMSNHWNLTGIICVLLIPKTAETKKICLYAFQSKFGKKKNTGGMVNCGILNYKKSKGSGRLYLKILLVCKQNMKNPLLPKAATENSLTFFYWLVQTLAFEWVLCRYLRVNLIQPILLIWVRAYLNIGQVPLMSRYKSKCTAKGGRA